MAQITSNKDAFSRSQRNVLLKYLIVFGGRIYRPVKPAIDPLLKKIKFCHVLIGLLGLMVWGSFWPVSQNYLAQERAAWRPWSAKAHSQMAMAWFNAGNEAEALKELERAKKLLIVKTKGAEDALRKAEEMVAKPELIRKEIESWEKVLGAKTEHRDVYLKLSLLSASLYDDQEAKFYWERANYLDPNNEEVQKIGRIIFSQL